MIQQSAPDTEAIIDRLQQTGGICTHIPLGAITGRARDAGRRPVATMPIKVTDVGNNNECEPIEGDTAGMLRRCLLLTVLVAAFLVARTAAAEDRYVITPDFGTIAFSVSNLGLFSSHGEFRRFGGSLVIDSAHPERTRIAVDVAAGSVAMSWDEGAAMLRSSAFFDVAHFPIVRFTSTKVVPEPGHRFAIDGLLEIRGITRPLVLEAALVDRHVDAPHATQVADFIVRGQLRRSAFGMTSDAAIISDRIHLRIRVRIQLPDPPHAG